MKDNRLLNFCHVGRHRFLCFLAFLGLGRRWEIIKGAGEIRTGIDIRGGIAPSWFDYPEERDAMWQKTLPVRGYCGTSP